MGGSCQLDRGPVLSGGPIAPARLLGDPATPSASCGKRRGAAAAGGNLAWYRAVANDGNKSPRLPAWSRRISVKVYGSEISYFTGKLEAYLRYKEIAYERVAMTARHFNRDRAARDRRRPDARRRAPGRPLDDRHDADDRLARDATARAGGHPARPAAGLREPPGRGLRGRMAVAAGDALPLELPARRAAAEPPDRHGAAPRRACAAVAQALGASAGDSSAATSAATA